MSNAQSRKLRSACLTAVSVIGLALAASGIAQQADGPALNPQHPERYVVEPGDTLWDIAAMFLQDPWYWPEIWQVNPQVENPHLIYPGDVLSLTYVNGQPRIQLERGDSRVTRLSPRVRSEPLEQAIQTIPFEAVRAFLARPAILSEEEIGSLPYVFNHPDGLLGSSGQDVYVRGTDAGVDTVFNLVHVGEELVDPDDGTVLGYEGVFVAQGRVRRSGDPATVRLTGSEREAVIGDLLVEEESIEPMTFTPRAPEADIEGRIISVVDGLQLIGQYQVVALNRGAGDGLAPGHVLRIFRTGQEVTDPLARSRSLSRKVRLPDEPAGTMMIFRTFDRMSYGLVMEAERPIAVLDTVRNP